MPRRVLGVSAWAHFSGQMSICELSKLPQVRNLVSDWARIWTWPPNARPRFLRGRKSTLDPEPSGLVPPQNYLAKLRCSLSRTGYFLDPRALLCVHQGHTLKPVRPRNSQAAGCTVKGKRDLGLWPSCGNKEGESFLEHLSTPFPDPSLISYSRMLWKAPPLFYKAEKRRDPLILKILMDSEGIMKCPEQ